MASYGIEGNITPMFNFLANFLSHAASLSRSKGLMARTGQEYDLMSRIAEYRKLETELESQRAELEQRRNDPELQKDVAFEAKLLELLRAYEMGLADVISILEPGFTVGEQGMAPTKKRSRRAREVKVYRNPLTGETVQSKGGNNKLLGSWKARFGSEEVESWVQR